MIPFALVPDDLDVLEAALRRHVEGTQGERQERAERLLSRVRVLQETESLAVLVNVDYAALEARMLASLLEGALASYQESPTGRLPRGPRYRGR